MSGGGTVKFSRVCYEWIGVMQMHFMEKGGGSIHN